MGYKNGDEVFPIAFNDGTQFKVDGTNMASGDQPGQRYGGREVGNVNGVTVASDGEGRIVWELDAAGLQDSTLLGSLTAGIPEGNALITAVYVEVETAFAAGSVDVEIGGTDAGGTPRLLTSAGMFPYALTTTPTAITSSSVITVNVDASVTGTAGYAKVIVEFTRI